MRLPDEPEKRSKKDSVINIKIGDETREHLQKLFAAYPTWSMSKIIRACIRAMAGAKE